MFTIRKYEAQYQNRLFQFLEICLPQSDRKFEPDGRHKMYRNVRDISSISGAFLTEKI